MRAYHTEGELVSDHATLVRLAVEVGLDAEEVRETLASDRFAAEVREDERTAAALGISAVPVLRDRPPHRRPRRAAARGPDDVPAARLGRALAAGGRRERRRLRAAAPRARGRP